MEQEVMKRGTGHRGKEKGLKMLSVVHREWGDNNQNVSCTSTKLSKNKFNKSFQNHGSKYIAAEGRVLAHRDMPVRVRSQTQEESLGL